MLYVLKKPELPSSTTNRHLSGIFGENFFLPRRSFDKHFHGQLL
jgi:hypothetical protein